MLKQVLRVISLVETSNIHDVNTNNSIADKLVDFLFGELSDVNTRNNLTYVHLNKLLCVNYALSKTLSAKATGVMLPYSFESLQEFITVELEDEPSLVNPLNSLMQRIDSSESWDTYLGYDSVLTTLFKGHDPTIDSLFNITFKAIKKLYPNYPNVYSNAISETFLNGNLKTKLLTYEKSIAQIFNKSSLKYTVGSEESRNTLIKYMFYYLGFNILQYSTKGKVTFKYESGVINPDIAEFLGDLETDNKSAKYPIYSLINMLNTFVFLDKGNGVSFFDEFIAELVGDPEPCLQIAESTKDVLTEVNTSRVFMLGTLQQAITAKEYVNSKSYQAPMGVEVSLVKDRLTRIVDLCETELENHSFFVKSGEFLLIEP
jgi:hypothetical protein